MASNTDTATSSIKDRFVGVVQVAGGALEVALGAGGVVTPTGLTQVGGVILIGHGLDTIVAGFRSVYSGHVQSTFTQSITATTARSLGASSQTARNIGTGADLLAGVGPSLTIGVMRRLAMNNAASSAERVVLAYLHRSAFVTGHNIVGIRQGGATAWIHFTGKPTGEVMAASTPSAAKYVLTEIVVTPDRARKATVAAYKMWQQGKQQWGYLGPNCTTLALNVLKEAGIAVPAWSRSPLLLHLGVNYGADISIVGGTSAAVGGANGKRR